MRAGARGPTSEREVQRSVVRLLETVGATVYVLSQPRHTMQSRGLPDLLVIVRRPDGRSVLGFLELKRPAGGGRPAGRLRPEQAAFRAQVLAVARSWDVAGAAGVMRPCGAVHHVTGGLLDVATWLATIGAVHMPPPLDDGQQKRPPGGEPGGLGGPSSTVGRRRPPRHSP